MLFFQNILQYLIYSVLSFVLLILASQLLKAEEIPQLYLSWIIVFFHDYILSS